MGGDGITGPIRDARGSIMVEFAMGGILFTGFVMGIIVMGLWIYNVSQVSQAARIAAHNVAVTGNAAESQKMAMKYLDSALIACPARGARAYRTTEKGFGVVEAYMEPLFPGFQKLMDPQGKSTLNGKILIRKEASRVLEYRFRPGAGSTN
jgi:Flp pilus assembly protein TadG